MAVKFELGMGMSEILNAFGTSKSQWSDAGRELLSRNKFKMSEGELQREDGRSISPRTLIYMPKKYVTPKSASDTAAVVTPAPAPKVPPAEKSKGLLAEYQAEFRELMKDKSARIAIYSTATLAVGIAVSSAVAIALFATTPKKQPRVMEEDQVEMVQEEEEDEVEEKEVVVAAKPPKTPASDTANDSMESSVAPEIAKAVSAPIAPVSASAGQFIFSSKTSAADLKAAIAEMNAQSRRGP